MPTFAEFYHNSTGYIEGTIPPEFSPEHVKPIPACGDRAIVWLDGRMSHLSLHETAMKTCEERGFIGYKLIRGESLLRTQPISNYVRV